MRILLFLLIPLLCCSQQIEIVDFKHIHAEIMPIPKEKAISGEVSVKFEMLQNAKTVFLNAYNMTIPKSVSHDISIVASPEKIEFHSNFLKGKIYQVKFQFFAKPKQALYFTGDQIWTQGQGKYTSHWLPSIDDMNDKIEFDLVITAPKDKTVISNGKLIEKHINGDSITWHFDMIYPMSSYLVAFAIGNYQRKIIESKSLLPIELYISSEDFTKIEPTYRHTQKIFDFLQDEIGFPFPWQNYKQVPVRDFLYAGMENTGCTIFSEAFVVDEIGFNDRNYVNVNAHELAHQWFGNLITETSGEHHWLQEGFATYYALLAEKEIFGEDYFYWKLYNSAEQLKLLSAEGKGESLLNSKASSITFYEKGAWALHVLKELIGDNSFNNAIEEYLKNHKFKNVTTTDFLNSVRNSTAINIDGWVQDWLFETTFQSQTAFESLIKSKFIKDYFEISALRTVPLEKKFSELKKSLVNTNDYLGQEVIYQLSGEESEKAEDLLIAGLESENLYVRQAIALSVNSIPLKIKKEYENLLKDPSYVTREAALYNLWINYPDDKHRYLDESRTYIGFQDKNIRQLWLTLAVVTPNYMLSNKEKYKEELRGYTSNEYSFEIREKAFSYIDQINLYNRDVIGNLIDASFHHNWRFRNYSRDLVENLAQNSEYRLIISNLINEYSTEEKLIIEKMLD